MKAPRSYSSETFIIAGSFVTVWIYFGARIWAGRNQIQLSPWWQLLLLPVLILLVVIFVRRIKRVLRSLRGERENHEPPRSPSINGHTKK